MLAVIFPPTVGSAIHPSFSLPAILELIKPRDAGPKIISDMTPPQKAWHRKLDDIEPYLPDLITEKIKDYCNIFFGTESLPNMEI